VGREGLRERSCEEALKSRLPHFTWRPPFLQGLALQSPLCPEPWRSMSRGDCDEVRDLWR
jgi:hypothetical protein